MLAVLASLALPSARHRREQALAAGVDDLPPEPVELHLPHPHLPHLGHHGPSEGDVVGQPDEASSPRVLTGGVADDVK